MSFPRRRESRGFKRFVATALLVLLILPACAVEKAPVYEREGIRYGVTDGLFRSRWWNYYERGCSYAEGEYWKEAEADFKEAIKQRDEDRRRARTYGVLNFIDYFPHRELGISYYHQTRYEEAISELERSITDTPSAKAYYFLDKARREWILQEGLDTQLPTLVVSKPKADEVTSAFQTRICGQASDDTFVSRIEVGGAKVPQEVALKEVSFCQEVSIYRGRNDVTLIAEDLIGRRTETVLTVVCDREGPQLVLDDINYRDSTQGRAVTIKGFVDDEHPIHKVSFNEVNIPVPKEQETSFSFSQPLLLGRDEDTIAFLTEDIAGNKNEGIILLEFPRAGVHIIQPPIALHSPTRLAYLSGQNDSVLDAGSLMAVREPRPFGNMSHGDNLSHISLARNVIRWSFPGGQKRAGRIDTDGGPTVRLKDLQDFQKAYFDTIYLEGNVQGPDPVTRLTLNGESLLKREGKNLFFGISWRLSPGNNELVFLAEDARGGRAERRIQIEYVVPRVLTLESRLRVFVIPFQPVRCETTLGEYVTQHLVFSLVDQKRFYVVNREELDRTLFEQNLSQTGLVDPKTAVKIGRVANAEEALVGSVYEGRKSVEIFAQMIDTETSEILLEKDVFHEDKSPARIRNITEGLALKFKHAMPMVQGNILKLEGSQLFTDIGTEESLRKGTRLVVFREGAELVHPETGRVLGCETEELGEAIVRKVDENQSVGEFTRSHAYDAVSLNDRVITK
jgi:hypothetical protein